jgi:hypothetical protein
MRLSFFDRKLVGARFWISRAMDNNIFWVKQFNSELAGRMNGRTKQ